MPNADPWQICLVFPRLDLPWALHGAHLCLAPGHDPRLDGTDAAPEAAYLLAEPTAPDSALTPEALGDFVAACALSCLLPGALTALADREESSSPLLHAAAFTGLLPDQAEGLSAGAASAPPADPLCPPLSDLLEALLSRWTRRHVDGEDPHGWEGTALFRSASLALRALAAPGRAGHSELDEGAALIFWTAACEVLFSRQERAAGWRRVLSRVRGIAWEDPRLRGENYIIQSDWRQGSYEIQCGNLTERLVKDMFDVRDTFLQGDRLTSEQVHVLRDPQRPRLTAVAPALYLTCLRDFLGLTADPSPGGPAGVEELLLWLQEGSEPS